MPSADPRRLATAGALLLGALAGPALAAPPLNLADAPLFLAPATPPNIMLLLDNSQSMDATMAGVIVSGDRPDTRGNIARSVLRSVLDTYRGSFNWGLTTFGTTGKTPYSTYAYYLGDAAGMVYVNDCADGFSASTQLRCVANPQPANGFNGITYQRSSDDADIGDAYYGAPSGPQLYGVGSSGSSYEVFQSRDAGTGWDADSFSGRLGLWTLRGTDAGFVPSVAEAPRQLWLLRGWGYADAITGQGDIVESVQPDSDAHHARLMALLQPETLGATGEIKNAALFTPLTGSLKTVRDYFADVRTTPATQMCQRNFVVLATDGQPTGRLDGSMYPTSDSRVTRSDGTSWNFGRAQQDLFKEIEALRQPGSAVADGVATYVVGMGDAVDDPGSVAALGRMAELGGTGQPLLGDSADALARAFQSIIGDIQSGLSAGSSVAVSSGSFEAGSTVYQARFSALDWSGDVLALKLTGTSGDLDTRRPPSAAEQLKAQNWDTQRAILTMKASSRAGIALRWPVAASAPTATELDAAQTDALARNAAGTADAFGAQRLAWLRGDASREQRNAGAAAPSFRNRLRTPLGDIVNSAPQLVGAPDAGYPDDIEAKPYSAFVAAQRGRTPMVYVGANDGMLHAFNAGDLSERLAYVPSMLIPALPRLADPAYTQRHRFYVDGTPRVGDVFYDGDWHTLLVSGLRAGGRGLFALDVTRPEIFGESNAAGIVRWEFQDPDLGHVYAQPLLAKTNNGRWSVIVGNGYKTAGGAQSALFVIDAESGALVRKITTGAGTAASPNGLSAPVAVDLDGDSVADVVYAGDLDGHLWKFDLSGSDSTTWQVANAGQPLFNTPAGQPITSRPDVTPHPRGGHVLVFGTGRYLDVIDAQQVRAGSDAGTDPNPNSVTQAAYGVWDKPGAGTAALTDLVQQAILATTTSSKDGNTYRLSTHAVGTASDGDTNEAHITRPDYDLNKRGWFVNLPEAGERIVADASVRGGRVVFTSITPNSSSSCTGGNGWILEFDVFTGNRLDAATFDTDRSNDLNPNDYLLFSGYDDLARNTSGRRIDAVLSGPAFMVQRSGDARVEDKYVNTSKGSVERIRETAGRGGEGRVMWREVR